MADKSDRTEWLRIFSRVSLLTQLGLSVVTPPILSVLLALFLQNRYGWGDWVILTAILIGVLSGVSSVFTLLRRETHTKSSPSKTKEDEP